MTAQRTESIRPLVGLFIAAIAAGLALAACTSDGEGAAPEITPVTSEEPAGATVTTGDQTTTTTASSATEATSSTAAIEETTTSSEATTTVVADTNQDLFVSPSGLTILDLGTGEETLVAFGDERSAVVDLVDRALGAPGEIVDGFAECPNGQETVAEWDDLVLDFNLDEQLISWRLPQGSTLTDADGLGLGTPVAELSPELQATIQESTIGTEFGTRETVIGVLSSDRDDAIVDSLFSVDTCAFR